jgi:hypothetical protein
MLKTACIILMLVSGNVFAQRLYVHDIQNGNYQSYIPSNKIVLYLLNSDIKTEGIIARLDSNSFTLRDGSIIPLSQIALILPPNKSKPIKRFFTLASGILMVTTGTVYFIGGAAILKDEPWGGTLIMITSAGIFAGGVWVLRKSKQIKTHIPQQVIDNVNYRVYIE